ncbi:hypothetical protein KY311_02790 [Candidatus Woesearchaeota archaeon]|nr:hypothetical protein [Candidatus Woesearchaeota archaeon]MBW3016810.1 hypothetical protein [Candidatus Woesearchaeota archaeon]
MEWLELIVGGSAGAYLTWRYMRNKTDELVDNAFTETCKDVGNDIKYAASKAWNFGVGCKNAAYRMCGKEVHEQL